MTVIAIDPGDKQSAVIHYDPFSRSVLESFFWPNEDVLIRLRINSSCERTLVIEMIASYGMPVGQEVFETCVWIGRFIEAWGGNAHLVYRKDVKLHLCGTSRAKDGNVRATLLDKFGGSKACGTKKAPGRLYGISGDKWSALAAAVTWAETRSVKHQTPNLFAEFAR